MTSLFVFRRDLRLHDNTGLIRALRGSTEVVPAFIFDPRQTGLHPYRSGKALAFMIASLRELDDELRARGSRLFLFEGPAEKVVARLLEAGAFGAVYANRDYTPFSRRRDEAIAGACREAGAAFVETGDALLGEPGEVAKKDGSPYTVFSPFFKAARALGVRAPRENRSRNYHKGPVAGERGRDVFDRILKGGGGSLFRQGGRKEARRILGTIGRFRDYEETRDRPALDGTTGLSPHVKFGTISIREFAEAVRKRLGPGHPLLRQLYWRDFFTHVAFHFERVFGRPFDPAYERLSWRDDPRRLERWQEGTTGFPIVDAGMRQLDAVGFIGNRVRMICASFLVKDLHVDWREGERFFATRLEDYDPCVNNGNWQWVASTGGDAAPFFRIFNPWLQQKRFDPEAAYIKRWVPELRAADSALIHRLDRCAGRRPGGYPEPIVDHAAESVRALGIYRQARRARAAISSAFGRSRRPPTTARRP
jgi:deoxyribodipyrimidine photo-lyase